MKNQATLKALIAMALLSSAACAPVSGDKATTQAACSSGNCSAANGSSDAAGADGSSGAADFPSLDLNGTLQGGAFANSKVVAIDSQLQELVLTLPLPLGAVSLNGAVTVPFPKVPGARVQVSTIGGRTALELRVPLKKLVKGIDGLDPARLPNGDALPAVPGGEMPSTAVSINASSRQAVALYLQKTMVGLFVSTSFDPTIGGISLTLPIVDKQKRVMGYVSNIPKKGTSQGGFFVIFQLPAEVARALDNYF